MPNKQDIAKFTINDAHAYILEKIWEEHSIEDQGGKHARHLRRHRRACAGERPYTCNDCGKAFVYPSVLQRHVVIHTGEKPYQCVLCGKAFHHFYALRQHTKIHTSEKNCNSRQCQQAFRQFCSSTRHVQVHTGAKPHKCKDCGKVVIYPLVSQRHLMARTGEKPYMCEQSGKLGSCSLIVSAYGHEKGLTKETEPHTAKELAQCTTKEHPHKAMLQSCPRHTQLLSQ
ncbi:hypothetical protein MC885_004506 [Smutsia gigantea]|nr:hypothetical protein MC885_004506 [Smutsia gigantea]